MIPNEHSLSDFRSARRQRRATLSGVSFSHVWAAVGAAAVGVVGGVVQSQQAKKNAPRGIAYTPVDPQQQQRNAIAGNLANRSQIENLSAQTNTFNQNQANSLMEKAVPGYAKAAQQLMQFGTDASANPYALPKEVQDQLDRVAAERGISVGQGPGSQFGQYSALKDLGLNSLQYGQQRFQQAIQALQTVTGTAPRVSPVSPLSFYLTPAQAIGTATNNNQEAQAVGQGAENAQSAANNWANQNMWSSITGGLQSGLNAYGQSRAAAAANSTGSSTAIPPSDPTFRAAGASANSAHSG